MGGTSNQMIQTMDDLLLLSMLIKVTTPELKAAQRHKQEEAALLRAKEESQRKVRENFSSGVMTKKFFNSVVHITYIQHTKAWMMTIKCLT